MLFCGIFCEGVSFFEPKKKQDFFWEYHFISRHLWQSKLKIKVRSQGLILIFFSCQDMYHIFFHLIWRPIYKFIYLIRTMLSRMKIGWLPKYKVRPFFFFFSFLNFFFLFGFVWLVLVVLLLEQCYISFWDLGRNSVLRY